MSKKGMGKNDGVRAWGQEEVEFFQGPSMNKQ
jgi:hypothetical protein